MPRLIGTCRVDTIHDIGFDPTFAFLFPNHDLGELAPFLDWLEPEHVDMENKAVRLDVGVTLLRMDGRVILVDGGIGEGKARHRPEWHLRAGTGLLDRLLAVGVHSSDVDTVICTHMHVDHVGWFTNRNGDDWVPTFPNADYLVSATELSVWKDRIEAGAELPPYMDDSILPLVRSGRMRTVASDHEVTPGLHLCPLPGHTLGQVGICIESDGTRAVLTADAFHSAFQIFLPDWSSALCQDPELARQTRHTLLAESAENGQILLPAHLRGSDAVRITRRDGRFIPVPVDLPVA